MVEKDRNLKYWNYVPKLVPSNIDSLSDSQLDDILNKRNILNEWNKSIWTKNVQNKRQMLKNIKEVPILYVNLPEFIVDRLKEAMDHYVRGQWLSSIALCGVICEYITYLFLEKFIKKNRIDQIIGKSKLLGNQYDRLKLLRDLGEIEEPERKLLDEIRKIRNRYIHLNLIDREGSNIKSDNLTVIKNLLEFFNSKTIYWNDNY